MSSRSHRDRSSPHHYNPSANHRAPKELIDVTLPARHIEPGPATTDLGGSCDITAVLFGGGDPSRPANGHSVAFIVNAMTMAACKQGVAISDLAVLIAPTARTTQESHDAAVTWATKFFRSCGLRRQNIGVLHDFGQAPSDAARAQIARSHMIYVPGGDPVTMIKLWKAYRVLGSITTALSTGTVLCGLSAALAITGAEVWSDTEQYYGEPNTPFMYQPVGGLGLTGGIWCPHADDDAFTRTNGYPGYAGRTRRDTFAQYLEDQLQGPYGALAVDNFTAVVLDAGMVGVIGYGAVTLYRRRGVGLITSTFRAGDRFRRDHLSPTPA